MYCFLSSWGNFVDEFRLQASFDPNQIWHVKRVQIILFNMKFEKPRLI